jgi:hypothetical protein
MCKQFCFESQKGRDHLRDRGVDGKIILKYILGKNCFGVDWFYVTQDGNQLLAVAKGVGSFQVP